MNELVDGAGATAVEKPQIEATFAAQRETAIALRTSTAAMRLEKLRRLEDAVLAHRAEIYRALAADLRKSEGEADLFDILQMISAIRHARLAFEIMDEA